jgi:serine/threonine-protein kinase RsbT
VLCDGADRVDGSVVMRARRPEGSAISTASPRPARVLLVASENDRLWASGEARRFAAELGFRAEDQARIAVCVAELASNAAKHAGGGRVEIAEVILPGPGCRVRVEDHGPGIAAVDDAVRDGFSEGRWLTPDDPRCSRRGLGVGLGAVRRLMSEVRVLSSSNEGLTIEAVLWRKPGEPRAKRR